MAAAPLVVLAVSLLSTAYSAYAQKQAGDFQARIAKRNAEAAERAARDAQARGLAEGVKHSLAAGQTRGAIRAGFGASGVEVTSGSPLDVLSDAAMFGELDKQTIKNNADREAAGLTFQAGNYLAQGAADKATGRRNAFGTILSGTASASGNYYQATRR